MLSGSIIARFVEGTTEGGREGTYSISSNGGGLPKKDTSQVFN